MFLEVYFEDCCIEFCEKEKSSDLKMAHIPPFLVGPENKSVKLKIKTSLVAVTKLPVRR